MEGLSLKTYKPEDMAAGIELKYQESTDSWYAIEFTEYENPPKVE
jgi:hypothetical protein